VAHEIALEHGLPVLPEIRKLGLHTYRRHDELASRPGTKGKTRLPKLPRCWSMESSRPSAITAGGKGSAPLGKKGKRHLKRSLKRKAARARRRASHTEDDAGA